MTETTAPTSCRRAPVSYGTIFLFGFVTLGALIGLPTFAYFHDYTWVDWAMFGLLYVLTGLGITVGYHRLIARRSFNCSPWVKTALLITGGWALENSALKWARADIRPPGCCRQDHAPLN